MAKGPGIAKNLFMLQTDQAKQTTRDYKNQETSNYLADRDAGIRTEGLKHELQTTG